MRDGGSERERETEGATGMVREERRALTEREAREPRAAEQAAEQAAARAGAQTTGDDEIVNRGERDLTSE